MAGKKSQAAKARLDEKRRVEQGYSPEGWKAWKKSRQFVPEAKATDGSGLQSWKPNEDYDGGTRAFGAASQSGLMAKLQKAKTQVRVAPRPKGQAASSSSSKKKVVVESLKIEVSSSSSKKVEVKKEKNEASSSSSKKVEVKKENFLKNEKKENLKQWQP